MPFLKIKFWIATALVIACICMWGCEHSGNETRFLDSGFQQDPGFVMVSDTTAIVPAHYYDHYENNIDDWTECTSSGISLIDSRKYGGESYWMGMVDSCGKTREFTASPIGAIEDSTVLVVFSSRNAMLNYYVWKVGQSAIPKMASWQGVPFSLNASIIRRWKNGNFLFKRYNEFALLDTAANTITLVTKEEAGWPDNVDDAQYFGDDLITIVLYPNKYSFSLVRNGADTLSTFYEDAPNDYDERHEYFSGRYIVRMQKDGWCIHSIDNSWQISRKPIAVYRSPFFVTFIEE